MKAVAKLEARHAEMPRAALADQLRPLSDLDALVRNWPSLSLVDLRSRIAVVLADRSSAASVWIAATASCRLGGRARNRRAFVPLAT